MATKVQKIWRYIVLSLANDRIILEEFDIRKMFESFKLPVPNTREPVLSMEFREAINKYGIVIIDYDTDTISMSKYILPHQIESVEFLITSVELRYQDRDALQRGDAIPARNG